MTTTHLCWAIDILLLETDRDLEKIVLLNGKKASAAEIRAAISAEKAAGREWLPLTHCDNRNPDGSCGGHPTGE